MTGIRHLELLASLAARSFDERESGRDAGNSDR
jgi:hypothetical protein